MDRMTIQLQAVAFYLLGSLQEVLKQSCLDKVKGRDELLAAIRRFMELQDD